MIRLAEKNKHHHQAIFFIIVGAVSALCHFMVLKMAVIWGQITPLWANVIGFVVAFWVSFMGHRYATFSLASGSNIWGQSLRWGISSIGAFLANQLLYAMALHYWGQAYYQIIWLIVTLIVAVFSFILGKYWAFRHEKNHS